MLDAFPECWDSVRISIWFVCIVTVMVPDSFGPPAVVIGRMQGYLNVKKKKKKKNTNYTFSATLFLLPFFFYPFFSPFNSYFTLCFNLSLRKCKLHLFSTLFPVTTG